MPNDRRDDAPPAAKAEDRRKEAAAAKPATATASTPAQRWLTSNELETLRNRLKKRFH